MIDGWAAHNKIHLAFKAAYTSETRAKREVEEKLEKLKQEYDKDKHDLENQIVALRVNGHSSSHSKPRCSFFSIRDLSGA